MTEYTEWKTGFNIEGIQYYILFLIMKVLQNWQDLLSGMYWLKQGISHTKARPHYA